jgi:hypothetical protein
MAIKHSFSAATFPCIAHCEYCAVARAVRCSGSCTHERSIRSCAARVGRRGRGGRRYTSGVPWGGCSPRKEEEEVLRQPSESAQPRLLKMHFLNQMAVVFSAPKDPQELLAELLKFRGILCGREACTLSRVTVTITAVFDLIAAITSWGCFKVQTFNTAHRF